MYMLNMYEYNVNTSKLVILYICVMDIVTKDCIMRDGY